MGNHFPAAAKWEWAPSHVTDVRSWTKEVIQVMNRKLAATRRMVCLSARKTNAVPRNTKASGVTIGPLPKPAQTL